MYSAINNALNLVFFERGNDGKALHLVLDKNSRAILADRLKEREHEVEAHCCSVVGKSLCGSGNPYFSHEENLKNWLLDGRKGRPPFTALLYTLSHAAELMVSDGKFSSANYYQRLADVTSCNRARLSAYGFATVRFWDELSKWLAATNYVFGRPTARPLSSVFKYVGLAISQAIVREADRNSFHHMFEKYGFGGADVISEQEIYAYLSIWIQGSGPTQQLKRAWTKEELRPRICDAAISELAEWSKALEGDKRPINSTSTTALSLAVSIVPRFPARILSIKCGVEWTVSSEITLASKDAENGTYLDNSVLGNFATVGPASAINVPDLLLSGVTYTRISGGKFQWKPRLIIPLTRSEKGPYWIEVSRVALGLPHLVLVRSERRIRELVEGLLSTSADAGTPSLHPMASPVCHPAGYCTRT
jgi:hypothetical protein